MAKKIPRPRVKSKKMHWSEKLFAGIAGLSPFTAGKPHLYQSMSGATKSGTAAAARHHAALLAKYGKWGMRAATMSGLTNPWVSIPAGLLYGANYIVDKGLEPYMDPETLAGGSRENVGLFHSGTISEEGHARMLRERLARQDLMARRNEAREGGAGFWKLARMRSSPDDFYQHEEYLKNAPNIKRDTQLSHQDFHGLSKEKEGKWFNFNEGGIASIL